MMILHHGRRSSASRRVRLCLEEKGLAYEGHVVDMAKMEHHSPDYLKINPLGVIPTLIHGWRKQPGMMGLRWPLLLAEQQKWLYDGSLDWLWPAAEKEGLPIAMMGGLFLAKFREIAERHPHLKMIVDHCGLNRQGQDAEAFVHLDELVRLAKLPNVAVKATGAPHYSTHGYPFRNIQDGLHRIFDAFGPKRFFWGTDITRMPCSYRECVTFFTEELPWLKDHHLEDVMGRGLCEWIGWNYKFGET